MNQAAVAVIAGAAFAGVMAGYAIGWRQRGSRDSLERARRARPAASDDREQSLHQAELRQAVPPRQRAYWKT